MSKTIAKVAAVGLAAGGLLIAGASGASATQSGSIGDRDANIAKCAGTAGCMHDYSGSDSRFRVDNLRFQSGLTQVWSTDSYFGTVTYTFHSNLGEDWKKPAHTADQNK